VTLGTRRVRRDVPQVVSRRDAHRDFEDGGAAAAVHLLAISGLIASGGGAATAGGAAEDARTGVGGGPCEAELHHVGHRYDRAHALWPTDGWTEKLEP
jgi:hypothetical protein